MNQNSNELTWVAIGLFIALLIAAVSYPTVKTVISGETAKLESVTNGTDNTPPAAWAPGAGN